MATKKPNHIMLRVITWIPIPSKSFERIARKQKSFWRPYKFGGQYYFTEKKKNLVHISQINSKQQVEKFLFERFGEGYYNVDGFGRKPNKKHNPKHHCTARSCSYHPKYKGQTIRKSKCRRYRIYKTGQSCKANLKRTLPNWITRARLNIKGDDQNYHAEWEKNLMHYYWFWKS